MHSPPDAGQRLTIGQFAEVALLSPKALRLYDDRKLLCPTWTDPATGYRYYAPTQAATGRLISLLRGAGVSLSGVEAVISAESPGEALDAIAGMRASTREQSASAETLLTRAAWHFTNDHPEEAVTSPQRHVVQEMLGDVVVLSSLSPVAEEQLDEHMATEIGHLRAVAQDLGVPTAGDPFGVFHAPVGGGGTGPLEVALPVAWMAAPSGDVRCYRLTGGPMATVGALGADTTYPAILTAYDLACSWIEQHGFTRTGPPREIWKVLPWEGQASMTVAWPFAAPLTRTEQR